MSKSSRLYLLILISLFLFSALRYIWNTSCFIEGTRYFCLFDDAMISMQYAKNLAYGHGLVWNAGGPRVEGFTNPLWTLIMAGVHLLGIPLYWTSLCVQLLGLFLLVLNLVCVYKTTLLLSRHSEACAFAATFLTAFYIPLNTWGLQGMEVSLVVLLLQASILIVLQSIDHKQHFLMVFCLLGMAFLTRPDTIVPYLVILLFVSLFSKEHRLHSFFIGAGFLFLLCLIITALRYWYYGEWLPNTYYLKMTGIPASVRMLRGWHALGDTIRDSLGIGLLLLCAAYSLANIYRKEILLLSVICVSQAAYSMYVGGDAWETFMHYPNRYLCIAMPSFMILLVLAGQSMFLSYWKSYQSHWIKGLHLAGFFVYIFCSWCSLHGATLPQYAKAFLKEILFAQQKPLYAPENSMNIVTALFIRSAAPPNTTVAVDWAGVVVYFSDLHGIDLYGKSDKKIARMEVPNQKWEDFKPGHNKWDLDHSIGTIKPDLLAARYVDSPEGYIKIWKASGMQVYVRQDQQALWVSLLKNLKKLNENYKDLCFYWGNCP